MFLLPRWSLIIAAWTLFAGLLPQGTAFPQETDQQTTVPSFPTSLPSTPLPKVAKASKPLRLHFIDVGHGDSCLIQTPHGSNILVDAGSSEVGQDIVRYLKNAGVKRIALIIATHPHSDHIGGMPAVLDAFDVDMVLDSGKNHPSSAYERYLEDVKSHKNIRFKIARAGQAYRIGDLCFKILSPTDTLPEDVNDCSIVCHLTYKDFSAMLTGDAGVDAERRLLRNSKSADMRSTILKVGHHGNRSSTSAAFLRAVAPKIAIISCRARPSGAWAPQVLHSIQAWGSKIYRTDRDGTIIVESDGKQYKVQTLGESNTEKPSIEGEES